MISGKGTNRLPNPSRSWIKVFLISLTYLYVILLIVAPLFAIIQGAFKEGLLPVWQAITDPKFLVSLKLSFNISVLVTLIHAVAGTIIAWVLARNKFPGKGILNGLVDVPFAVSPVVVGYMLLLLFGRNGLVAPLLQSFDIKVAFAVPGMTLATLFVTIPIMIRELIPLIQNLDRSQELAASTLGAKGWKTFWQIIFPALRWGVIYGLSLTFARALGEFGAVLVVGGGIQGRTETATIYIYHALEERHYIAAYSASLLLGIMSMVLVIGVDLLKKKK